MKKIALFSLLMCLCGVYAVPAFATCGAHTLGFDGNQDPDDDEFLYENQKQFDLTKQGYNNSNEQNSGEGKGIECDTANSAGCDSGRVIELLPGHVFKGGVVNEKRKYQCTSSFFGDDMWEVVGGFCETQWGNLNIGQSWNGKTTIDCSGLDKTENNVDAVELWDVICREGGLVVCKPTKCKEGYKLDAENGKCVCDNCGGNRGGNENKDCPAGQMRATKNITVIKVCSGDKCEAIVSGKCYDTNYLKCMEAADRGEPANWNGKSCNCGDRMVWDPKNYKCVAKGNAGGNGTKKTCKELYGKYPERLACCEAGKDTKWTGSVKDGTCSCVDKSKVWDSAKKQCVTPEQGGASELTDCFYNYDVSIKCANGNTYHEKGSERLKKSQLADFTCDDFNSRFGTDVKKWQELYGDLCKDEPVQPIVVLPGGPSDRELEKAQEVLSAFTASAKDEASVWKTSEGKFNTTRLASDITAGVVLGTVGGVVTGNIIKKNQVKKGFEALHCTVGGQKVADWGDEFSVGLQR